MPIEEEMKMSMRWRNNKMYISHIVTVRNEKEFIYFLKIFHLDFVFSIIFFCFNKCDLNWIRIDVVMVYCYFYERRLCMLRARGKKTPIWNDKEVHRHWTMNNERWARLLICLICQVCTVKTHSVMVYLASFVNLIISNGIMVTK